MLAFLPVALPCSLRRTRASPRACATDAPLWRRLAAPDQRTVLPLLATLRPSDAPALRASAALVSPNRAIRAAAHAALGRVGAPLQDAPVLLSALQGRDDHSVRAAAAASLGDLFVGKGDDAPSDVVDALVNEALEGDHFITRYSAVCALGTVGGEKALDCLVIVQRSPLEIAGAVAALTDMPGACADKRAMDFVLSKKNHNDDLVRGAVARALGVWSRAGVDFVHVLESMQIDEETDGNSPHVRNMLAQALFGVPRQSDEAR